MWELGYKESWVPKNWCFWTVVLEKTPESPLDCKEIKPVNPKGNQSWIFIGRIDTEAKAPILWPHDAKNWLIGKDPDAGKDWRQEEKGMIEDEMVEWHHQPNAHEFEQAAGVGDGQGSLASCSPWGHRVRHNWVTELNWTPWTRRTKSWDQENSVETKLVGNFREAQWWRLSAFTAMTWVKFPVREGRSCNKNRTC